MDADTQTVLSSQEAQISALTQRVAALENMVNYLHAGQPTYVPVPAPTVVPVVPGWPHPAWGNDHWDHPVL